MTSSPQSPNADSSRNLLKYSGQNYQFLPTYRRNREPDEDDLRDPLNQGYYPVPSIWIDTSNLNVYILVRTLAARNGGAKWVLFSTAAGDLLNIQVDSNAGGINNPVLPTAAGTITITGAQVGPGVVGADVILSNTLAEHIITLQIQQTSAVAAKDTSKNGVAHFNSGQFTNDQGFISLKGGGEAIDSIQVDIATAPGTLPVVPDAAGLITVTGAQIHNAGLANVIQTDTKAQNQYTIEIQQAGVDAAQNLNKNGVSHYNNNQFTLGTEAFVSLKGGTTPAILTLSDDVNATISPSATGNIQLVGHINEQGATKFSTVVAGTNLATINPMSASRWIVDPLGTAGFNGTHQTITAAIASATSGDTIFLLPGTYTESFTLKAGVNLTAYSSDGYRDLAAATGPVIIAGKMTMTTAGTVSIANVRLQTNADFFLSVTGVAASIVYLQNCYLDCTNHTGIQSTSTSSEIRLIHCGGNLGTTGIALFALSGGGNLEVFGGDYNNSGSSVTASTWSAGILTMRFCEFDGFLTSSGNGAGNIYSTFFNDAGLNTTIITQNSTGTALSVWHSQIYSGTASAISVGAGASLNLYECEIMSSNTNSITGAGSVNLADILYIGTSQLVNTTTQTLSATNKGAYKVTLPAANYTVLSTDEIVGINTAAARAITLTASPSTGQKVTIKDVTGGAAGFNITITPAAGLVDGAATKVISANYGSVTLFYSGTGWFAI